VLHPRSKDETDLELAVRYARQHGADEVLILGAMGERWDQTLANLTLLAAFDLPAGRLRLIDGSQEVCLVRGGETLPLDGRPGDTVSLIPIGGDADGVTTEGLEYPLRGETLRFGLTRGVSNVIQTSPVSVGVRRGSLLVTLIRMSWDEVM
jgi:thiamine pyrophosphokinase